MRRSIDALEQRLQLEQARDKAGDELDGARLRLAPLTDQRAEARQASQRFRAALAEVYRDPVAARREFHARAQRDGVSAAAAEIGRHPERFGDLRGAQLGPIRSAERTATRLAAPRLEAIGAKHINMTRDAWASRIEYRAARTSVAELTGRIKTLDAELAQGRGSTHLQRRLGRELQALGPTERRALRRSLPLPYRRILAAAIAAGRAFVREQGHER